MDDFIGVRDVIASERIESLSRRSNTRGLAQLVSHIGALALCTWALALTWGTWWMVPFFFAQGVLINFLFACQHETNHNTAFASRWLNIWVSRLCGLSCSTPATTRSCSILPIIVTPRLMTKIRSCWRDPRFDARVNIWR